MHKILQSLLLALGILLGNFAQAQVAGYTGRVTDAGTGEPLPGVTIVIKGTTNGTITNADGYYNLNAAKGATIQFSYVGYLAAEQIAGDRTDINIALTSDLAELDEVIVIGYGQVKKKDLTGSVNAVSSADFNRGAITSPQDLLVGKSAGVVITQGDGRPGSAAMIRIRGGSSMSASNDPLIVVDGVPLPTDGIDGMSNSLASINPNDIETFTILKDASATAIYGNRASNGVIMITTKKGGGDLKINYSGTASVYTIGKLIETLNAEEYKKLVESLYTGDALARAQSLMGEADTDWQDQIYDTAFGHDHNISASGTIGQGSSTMPWRISLGYTNQNGILKNTNIDRTTLSVKLTPSLLDNHLKIDGNLKGVYNKSSFSNGGAIGAAIQFDPTHPVYDENSIQHGYWAWMDGGALNSVTVTNPVAMVDLTDDTGKIYRGIGNLQLDYKLHFLPDMRANLNLALDYSKTDGKRFTPENTKWTSAFKGEKAKYEQKKRMELLEFYVNYAKDIKSIESSVDVMAGYSWQHFWRSSSNYATSVDESQLNTDTSSKSENYMLSFFGRLNYTWKDRYLLTGTLRYDGSSRFSKDNRWGLFPSAALAWRINNEEFMRHADGVSDLKLRLGFGITGQENIGSTHPYLATYSMSTGDNTAQYQFGNTFYNTLRPNGYDANIKWEETTTWNAGLDFGFFEGRLSGAIDYYYRETDDLLNNVNMAGLSNLTNRITTNVGTLTNQGVELSLNTKLVSTKNTFLDLAYNVSYNKNEITKLTNYNDPTYIGVETGGISGGTGQNIQVNSVGRPYQSFYVYQQVYDNNGKPIEGVYVDRDKNGIINDNDRYHYKKAAPDVLMGLSARFGHKNWDASFAARASLGNYIYNNNASNHGIYYNVYNAGNSYLSNVVKQSEKAAFTSAQYRSDFYIENASFLRMDNVSVGYLFDNLFNNKSSLHISAMVQNVFVISEYDGIDPETSGGIDNNLYPRPRTFVLGINLNF